ncbi:hypothetical protein PR202_ga07838 [Eleusine coracana subsp. coracana]|uniref:Uncharacterized protein n=1 Tax=Eleusine coracana subsp. coracana TaxID=191504 RepID=A0AAV5C1P9_ELECO|nr:hypothetical protein QOZ80_2AG0116750 [Eleusine coracana subsp. coracana]GJM91464.1 hypothetical protein PR202_ga07838 [Eleusine coracana subsp. coracana]
MAAQPQQQQQSVLQSFPFRAAVLALCVALLPLLPAQAPEGLVAANGNGVGRAFLAKAWELLHLLVVGIAVSYGLFSRKNDTSADHGVVAHPEKHEDSKPADARYVSRMFRDSLAPFIDDDDYEVLVPGIGGGGREDEGGKARSWSAVHRPDEPVVVVTNGSRGSAETLSLPVRTLKSPLRRGGPQDSSASGPDETVLPSPIPWRSRSGRFDAARPASPKRLSPASSSSRETLAKATEEYYSKRIRSPRRSSSTSTPPAPPPPPPPFLVHGYHPPAAERRHAAKSFKEELQDHSVRSRGQGGDHFSLNKSGSFNASAYSYNTANSSPAKPRSSFDSSSSSASVGKSVRTFRARDPPVFQDRIQDVPEDLGDAQEEMHGSEEPYGSYRAYQSIPRFQYERSVSDPILGGVAVSSDDTESSDDDDEEGRYSTRETTPEVDENEVDKKAEEFIARFREQIRRQRIESIKRSAGPRGVKHGK